MRLKIRHITRYDFDQPVHYGLQQLRKTPKSFRAQDVVSWITRVEGGRKELTFEDYHHNIVELISFENDCQKLTVACEGEVEMTETHGVVGPHRGPSPLWLFNRATPRTQAGSACRAITRSLKTDDPLDTCHALSAAVREAVTYEVGGSETEWTAEDALKAGKGVCQDHAHVFIACARALDIPARYVSGYLKMDDRQTQDATHAWAEAHVPELGWVGFDVSNAMSPDMRYVRVATGLDYDEVAPVTGTRFGGAGETLSVEIEVAQQ